MSENIFRNIGEKLASTAHTRIQLCGRLTVRICGRRLEDALPGRQGRLLFAYLVVNRQRVSTRDALIDAIWPRQLPGAPEAALNALLAKLRSVLGADALAGKHDLRLTLPSDTWIDLEAAREGLHRAECAVSLGDWAGAWGPSRVALHIGIRTFMPAYDAPWMADVRRELHDILLRAHECVGMSGMGLAGPELASAERSGRALVKLAPYRESGYRCLMQTLAAQGNVAEALLTYEELRQRLRDELGSHPSPATQSLHAQLVRLGHTASA